MQLQQKLFSEKGLFSTLVQIASKNPETAAMFHQILPSRECRNVQYHAGFLYTSHNKNLAKNKWRGGGG